MRTCTCTCSSLCVSYVDADVDVHVQVHVHLYAHAYVRAASPFVLSASLSCCQGQPCSWPRSSAVRNPTGAVGMAPVT